jgi:hypothetical protein
LKSSAPASRASKQASAGRAQERAGLCGMGQLPRGQSYVNSSISRPGVGLPVKVCGKPRKRGAWRWRAPVATSLLGGRGAGAPPPQEGTTGPVPWRPALPVGDAQPLTPGPRRVRCCDHFASRAFLRASRTAGTSVSLTER